MSDRAVRFRELDKVMSEQEWTMVRFCAVESDLMDRQSCERQYKLLLDPKPDAPKLVYGTSQWMFLLSQ